MSASLEALRSSVARLQHVVAGLDPDQVTAPAYPSEWTIADLLSHIGSGAVILGERVDESLAGTESPPDFPQSVWDDWNAKPPSDQVADGVAADLALLAQLDGLSEEERTSLQVTMGPLSLDFEALVGLRLNEHALHTWDVEVTQQPDAAVAEAAVRVVVDNLAMIVGFTAKPIPGAAPVHVRTSGPVRDFVLRLDGERVSLDAAAPATGAPDLELPAEALIRLVYGRLDHDHTPAVTGSADLEQLRQVFPGP
jgi:uncharacterized protein (TIGR03083 family)